jgi:predicted nucleic acid-binding protein
MILVDPSVWIDYFNGVKNWHTDKLDENLSNQEILLADIILTEILHGFDRDIDFKKAKQALDVLNCVQLGGKLLAVKAASNFRFLRSKGVTIRKTIDMLIGSWCIHHGMELLHNDIDFDHMALHLPLKIYAG